jgi:hypothetical protein
VIPRRLTRRALLSATLLAGCAQLGPPPLPPASVADDRAILDNLLALEYAAGAGYEGTRALLSPERSEIAAQFQSEHARHADALAALGRERGGEPVAPAPFRGVVESETAALRLLEDEERGLVSAYVGSLPAFADRNLARAMGNILAVEALHWAAWRTALGQKASDGPFLFDQKPGMSDAAHSLSACWRGRFAPLVYSARRRISAASSASPARSVASRPATTPVRSSGARF